MRNNRHPNRYRTAQGPEAQYESGSRGRVLRNRRGIQSKREMDRAEYEALVAAQAAYLTRIGSGTRFSASLLCRMHRDWLGELYEWAGQYRSVELEKGGFRWPPAVRVARNMDAFERQMLAVHTPCRGVLPQVAERIAKVHAELLRIHPFRDGNGRLARWLADLMALQAGLSVPRYGLVGRGSSERRRQYLNAVQRGYAQDYEPLTRFFLEAFGRRTRAREP